MLPPYARYSYSIKDYNGYVTAVKTTHATPPRFTVPPFPEFDDVFFGVLLTLQPADQPRVSCWSCTELQSLSRPQQLTRRSDTHGSESCRCLDKLMATRFLLRYALEEVVCVPSSKAGRPSAVPSLYACQDTLVLPSLSQPPSSFISENLAPRTV
jgi:hypothetical protein